MKTGSLNFPGKAVTRRTCSTTCEPLEELTMIEINTVTFPAQSLYESLNLSYNCHEKRKLGIDKSVSKKYIGQKALDWCGLVLV